MSFKVLIAKQAKSTTQSGRAKTASWTLSYETETARVPERLMGWVSSQDTLNQPKLSFATLDEAIAFATENGFDYEVLDQSERIVTPRSYLDNFKYRPYTEE
jgi:hypothetical protein